MKTRTLRNLFLSLMCIPLGAPQAIGEVLSHVLIADFDNSVQNKLGGFYRCVGGGPAQIYDQLLPLGKPELSAWRIDLSEEAPMDDVGVLISLYDETRAKNAKITISDNSKLTGNLIGELGNRKLIIALATSSDLDAAREVLGTIKADQLYATDWTTIRLPISSGGKNFDPRFIRIQTVGTGPCWFAIDKLAFSAKGKTREREDVRPTNNLRKALWHWHSASTLRDKAQSRSLLQLCKYQGITDLYCQVVYSYDDGNVSIRLIDEQRKFNAEAAALSISVHALDGAPEYVFRKNHPRMIRWTESIGDFNLNCAPDEQFQGIHLDNEPYVLPEWQSENSREVVIKDFIELNKKLSQIASQYQLEYGVDIPFWWDARDDEGRSRFNYQAKVRQLPLLDALFPLVDNVGVMSYRDRVTGSNGVVALCLEEFKLGQKYNVDVLASIELGVGKAVEPGTTFGVYPWSYFRSQYRTLERLLSRTTGCAGLAIHHSQPFAEAMKD